MSRISINWDRYEDHSSNAPDKDAAAWWATARENQDERFKKVFAFCEEMSDDIDCPTDLAEHFRCLAQTLPGWNSEKGPVLLIDSSMAPDATEIE